MMFSNLFSRKRTQNNSDESLVKGKNDDSMNEYNTSISGMMKELDDLIADIDRQIAERDANNLNEEK